MRRVAVVGSSGSGKTTVGRALATQLGCPFIELDALHWGPEWTEATADELRARVEPIVVTEEWVIDGSYRGKIGELVLERAEIVLWLDLPVQVWFPRLFYDGRSAVSRIVRSSSTGTARQCGRRSSAGVRSSSTPSRHIVGAGASIQGRSNATTSYDCELKRRSIAF